MRKGQELPSMLLLIFDSSTNFSSFFRVLLSVYYLTGEIPESLLGSCHHNSIYFIGQRTNVRMFPVVKYDYSKYTIRSMGNNNQKGYSPLTTLR